VMPVRGSTEVPSLPPSWAVPRKPCSGPKTAPTSTPLSAMSSTMERKLARTPVGLVMTPTLRPAKMLQLSAAARSAPLTAAPGFPGRVPGGCATAAGVKGATTAAAAASPEAWISLLRLRFMGCLSERCCRAQVGIP